MKEFKFHYICGNIDDITYKIYKPFEPACYLSFNNWQKKD